MATTKTLEDARDGLLRYWKIRPDGGTRTELLQMAAAQGFEEPLLNEWLDVFLQGFVDIGRIDTPYYPALAALVATSPPEKIERAVDAMFTYLTRPGRPLFQIRLQNAAAQLQADVDALKVEVNRIAAAEVAVPSATNLSQPNKAVCLAALAEAKVSRKRLIASKEAAIRDLLGTYED